MDVPKALKLMAIPAIMVAEVALIVAVAYGVDVPGESIVVAEDDIAIEVVDQRVYGAFAIARVVTPVDGWVIVRAAGDDGAPAELLGAAPVTAGENVNVAVAVDASRDLPDRAFVSVVADRGVPGEFEYTTGSPDDTFSLGGGGDGMMGEAADGAPAMTESMDWLLVSGGRQVAEPFAVTPFNVTYRLADANIGGSFLEASGTSARILAIDAPEDSWIAIIRVTAGGADSNEIIGSARVSAGRTEELSVPVRAFAEGSEVTALLVADLGTPGVLEIDPVNPARSVDAPYIVRSWYIWKRVTPSR